jgi:hypothetical protein
MLNTKLNIKYKQAHYYHFIYNWYHQYYMSNNKILIEITRHFITVYEQCHLKNKIFMILNTV